MTVVDPIAISLPPAGNVWAMAKAAVEVARDVTPGCVAAELAVVNGARVTPIVRSRARAGAGAALDAVNTLMADCGEGPPISAVRTGRSVTVSDLGSDRRWPSFGPRAARRGVGAAVSVPVALRGETCALTIYLHAGAPPRRLASANAVVIADLLCAAAAEA